jgi:cell division protein FtsW (lipid II flippase)
MGPLRLHDWAGDGDVVDASVVVPLLSLRVEVDAGPSSDRVNDSAIRLINEVFLFWCLGVILVVDVWLMRVQRRKWGWYDLYLLVVLVCVVG